jgi:hypothetical protein
METKAVKTMTKDVHPLKISIYRSNLFQSCFSDSEKSGFFIIILDAQFHMETIQK